ncbi:Sin-like protein conserved region-domain containing protein [Nitzschia inconspicua]|uniref:Sin-like protein conserved region-domain containing protein n=1 Tax=Nitzschia inconspicua TaxID=303405 RepID=A0A9K3PSM6_9STRA|nr:Sin-like protein conserved region-domain containing protein [Nitzschia inconspicua]KAG7358182.1 Sin-like protein conserved region-domain containing protein [Nitzschia inconspicua]
MSSTESDMEQAVADVVSSVPMPIPTPTLSSSPAPTSSSKMDIDDHDDDDDDDIKLPAKTTSHQTIGQHHYDDDDDEEDDDDEIVQEIPVFLSQSLSHTLRLIQYPLQRRQPSSSTTTTTATGPIQPPEPSEVRIRSRHYMMEVDYHTPNNIQYEGNFAMTRRTYSSHTVPISTHLAVGKLTRNNDNGGTPSALHLMPLSGILQLRPNFTHIDQEIAREEADEAILEDEYNGNSTDRKPLGYQKKESERAALARKSSYAFKRASEDSEVWQVLQIYDATSQPAQDIVQQVTDTRYGSINRVQPAEFHKRKAASSSTASSAAAASLSTPPPSTLNERYVNSLNYLPPPFNTSPADQHKSSYHPPYAQHPNGHLKRDPDDQIGGNDGDDESKLSFLVSKMVRLMQLGSPMPFSVLRSQFSPTLSDGTLLQALGSCAVMVRGNFCLSSRLMGMPLHMAQARTFLLFLFQSMGVVHRKRLEHVFVLANNDNPTDPRNGRTNNNNNTTTTTSDVPPTAVTPAMLEYLLNQVGRKEHRSGGWVLKVDDDVTFGEQHPQTLLVHVQHWATLMEHHFALWLQRYRE